MRFIPTLLHGIADYVVGLIVIGLPFFLGLEGATQIVLVVLGLVVLAYSLMTDYELGMVRFLRIRFHLLLDGAFGIAMLLLPTLLGLAREDSWPIYVIGILALTLALTTEIRAVGTAATSEGNNL